MIPKSRIHKLRLHSMGSQWRILPPPVDALRTAADLERRLAAYHMDSIGVFRRPRLQEMFKAMMAADKHHVETLTAALAKLSPSSERDAGSEERG